MTISNIVLEALAAAVKVTDQNNIDYCLFGGLAISAYKRLRSTMDVDLMVAIDKKQIQSFIMDLEKRGFKFDRKKGMIKIGDFEFIRCIYTDKKYQIDIFVDFVTVKSEFQKEILRRKQILEIQGLKVNVASCEDLILLKMISDRPIDRADAEALVAENIKVIDKNYLVKWAKTLGVERRIKHMLGK